MKSVFRMFLLAAAVVSALPSPSFAQTANLKAEVLKDWTDMKDTMMKIAAEMPEDKYGFKSTPPQRSYAEQVLHVATVNMALLQTVGGKAPAPAINAKATTKADVMKAMADTFDYGTALINEHTPESITQTVNARFLGQSSRLRIFYFLNSHTMDIYGQMVVYLRLNGHVPPASQRP